MADATAIFGILKCVSKHYKLDYADLLDVCKLHTRKQTQQTQQTRVATAPNDVPVVRATVRATVPTVPTARTTRTAANVPDIPIELEFISIGKKGYLYHPASNRIFSNDKKPRHVGHLCHESFQVILKKL